jgi:hypothetical protein
LAVLSDASDFRREPGSSILTGLLGSAALLREHTGMAATALLVTANNADELIAELRRVAPDFSGIYLVHTDPARGQAAQAALAGTVAVITDRQTTAVTLIAAALTTLSRSGTAPAAGRVVIAGAELNPLVAAIAVAAGIGEIDSWGVDDALNFPLRTLIRRGAIVIDLLGPVTRRRRADTLDPPTPVVAVDKSTTALLALPGLLNAARRSGRPVGLAGYLASAQALVERTPPGQVLPELADPGLTDPGLIDPAIAGSVAGARPAP